jgi:hypothetical protein
MKRHFAAEEWIDFVNDVTSGSERDAMRKHLEHGCDRCQQNVGLWEKIRRSAAAEANYQPPEQTLRVVKAGFAASEYPGKQKKKAGLLDVLFDSFLQPVFEGARSAGSDTRQMLYRADPYQIDVQIEPQQRENRIVVTGQVLDNSHPEAVGREIMVTLSNLRGHVVNTLTNENGEFRGEVENSGDLQLTFARSGAKPVVISLRDALGKPGASR